MIMIKPLAWLIGPLIKENLMATHSHVTALSLIIACLALVTPLQAVSSDYKSELFENTKLIYDDSFDGPLNTEFWEVRQSTTWEIKDGILTGSQSSKEFQEKMTKSGEGHEGFKPVIWLKQVPENFVCSMRMRYNSDAAPTNAPIFDLGHHIHTLSFTDKLTTLTIKKNVQVIRLEEVFLPYNQWADVAIELKKGTILLKVNDKQHRFDSPEIDMTGQHQIDFKGINLGTCQIDRLTLWEGVAPSGSPEPQP
jgi:hypothetical protein